VTALKRSRVTKIGTIAVAAVFSGMLVASPAHAYVNNCTISKINRTDTFNCHTDTKAQLYAVISCSGPLPWMSMDVVFVDKDSAQRIGDWSKSLSCFPSEAVTGAEWDLYSYWDGSLLARGGN